MAQRRWPGGWWLLPQSVAACYLVVVAVLFRIDSISGKEAAGAAALAPSRRYITFAIETTWTPGTPYGTDNTSCTSGGVNHAAFLLTAFFEIASQAWPARHPLILRPGVTYAPTHGKIPLSVRWSDYFAWDVDSNELRTPRNVWAMDPARFDVFDVYEPSQLISRLRTSEAEVAVLHMYGTSKYPCVSYIPFQNVVAASQAEQSAQLRPTELFQTNLFRPSPSLMATANGLIEALTVNLGGNATVQKGRVSPSFVSVHARRRDVLRTSRMWPRLALYHSFTAQQLALATSPEHVLETLALMKWPTTSPVLIFTDEENNPAMFDRVKATYPLTYSENDLVALLPVAAQKKYADNYSRFLLFVEVVKRGAKHVCTAKAKFGVSCDAKLTDGVQASCTLTKCEWVCAASTGRCVPDLLASNLTAAAQKREQLVDDIQKLRTKHGGKLEDVSPAPCAKGANALVSPCFRLSQVNAYLGRKG